MLGNSLLGGAGVGRDGQFTTLLARRLDGRKVLNLSLPGGGTEHDLLTYRRYAAPLQPKLVLALVWAVWEIRTGCTSSIGEGEVGPGLHPLSQTYNQTHATGAPPFGRCPSKSGSLRSVSSPNPTY